ncbi:MAG: hypothetical protein LBK61_07980 [Spirochaetaceae bacterium]|jgi:hypothetical protein|nr:hypothetical protein [Spirochaetaceae bacterium]
MDLESIKKKIETEAVPMEYVEFSRDEYNKLFPSGTVKTPIGTVKMGQGQYNKLIQKGREYLLWAMRETLAHPTVILPETRDGKKHELFIKSFSKDGKKTFAMSVIVEDGPEKVAISTSERKKNQIYKKLENLAGNPSYITRGMAATLEGTSGNTSATQQDTLSPDSENKSTPKNDPGVYFQLTREG